jgi:hypothetical protein
LCLTAHAESASFEGHAALSARREGQRYQLEKDIGLQTLHAGSIAAFPPSSVFKLNDQPNSAIHVAHVAYRQNI